MVRIDKMTYKEMRKLGLLKDGQDKNYAVTNRQGSSRKKTVYVEENMYKRYKQKVERNKI